MQMNATKGGFTFICDDGRKGYEEKKERDGSIYFQIF